MAASTQAYGANIAFIEELYERYRANPDSVSASWREFFRNEVAEFPGSQVAETPEPRQPGNPVTAPAPPPPKPTAVPPLPTSTTPLRGAAAKIATNMEASLGVPTATSIRTLPVKVLEENRRIINNHLTMAGQAKASYTHFVAWAIVRAIKDFPRLNAAFLQQDGQPARLDREDVNIGLAIDVERKDGTRSLVVPNVKRAQTLDFAQFLKAYNDVVRKARNNTLEIADFEGTTISLTNPGTIGPAPSVPRP